ncbi:MAG: ATP-binding cassette domain-containing protein, partial [Deinococcales bacterium]
LVAALGALLLLAPSFLFDTSYRLGVARTAFYMAGLVATWSLLAGIAGQFSFAHVALAGLGGYAGAIWSAELMPAHPGLADPWLGVLVGTVFAWLVGTLLGLLLLRLRAAYLALFTIAFSEIARIVIVAESEITGGRMSLGVLNLPGSELQHYYLVLAALALLLAAVYGLIRSRTGVFLRAMREDHDAAASLGVNVVGLKVFVFSVTSALVGLMASVYFHTTPRLVPENLDLLLMSLVIAYAVIGGLESPMAGAVATVVLTFVLEAMRRLTLGHAATLTLAALSVLLGAAVLVRSWRARRTGRERLAGALAALVLIAGGAWLAAAGSIDVQPGVWRFAAFGLVLVLTLRFARNGLLAPLLERLAGREAHLRQTVAFRDAELEGAGADGIEAEGETAPTAVAGAAEGGTGGGPTVLRRVGGSGVDLRVDGLQMAFGGQQVVNRVGFDLTEPTIIGLIGPNGAGKTTFTNVLCGVYTPTGGAVLLNGERVDGLPPFELARRGLGRTFQIPRAFARMTVLDNLLVPALAAHAGEGRAEALDRAHEALRFLTIDHLAHEYARALSGGQKKLLELARLLMLDPSVLILDEPFAGVHPRLKTTIYGFVERLREAGRSFIIIEHDMETIFSLSERLIVLADGTLIADGHPDVVRHDPAVKAAYLGEDDVVPEGVVTPAVLGGRPEEGAS